MDTVNYHMIPTSKVEDEMNKIRRGYNTEGSVMYFVDGHKGNVIGLLKKKTAWYVTYENLFWYQLLRNK